MNNNLIEFHIKGDSAMQVNEHRVLPPTRLFEDDPIANANASAIAQMYGFSNTRYTRSCPLDLPNSQHRSSPSSLLGKS